MPIYKKHRVFSEKLTSIEDPIAVVQRGVISFVPSKGTSFLIPTFIDNPVNVKLQALSVSTANALHGSLAQGWYCDLKLHYATNAASSGFGSIASNVLIEEIGRRIRMVGSKLYVATASMAAGSASNTGITSTASTSWRKLEEYGSNTQRYLVVNVPTSASVWFKTVKQKVAFEVIGYEY